MGWRLIGRDDFGSRCDCECVACSVRIVGGAIGELLHCAWHGADAYAEGSRQRSWAQCRFSLFYSCVRKVVGKAVGAMYCSPSVFGVCPHVRRHVGLYNCVGLCSACLSLKMDIMCACFFLASVWCKCCYLLRYRRMNGRPSCSLNCRKPMGPGHWRYPDHLRSRRDSGRHGALENGQAVGSSSLGG